MPPRKIVDSHIHLWPESASNEDGHAWMTPGMPLAKRHLLSDYHKASSQHAVDVEGVVYVETDRRYDASHSGGLAAWAKGPLEEIVFLRNIVEGDYGVRDGRMLIGIVLWAPMDRTPGVLKEWLRLAEETAGPTTWKRVKGFRFLLQSIHDRHAFEALVLGEAFISNLRLLGQRGFSFDVGVDQRSGGAWQLESVARAMNKAHANVPEQERVGFIFNHLCKPDFSCSGVEDAEGLVDSSFSRWRTAIESMARCSNTYMKLSGAFSELPTGTRSRAAETAARVRPWVTHVMACFGPERVMFGSDWPVCNVHGPLGEGSWVAWKDVVELILADQRYGLSEQDRERVWRGTACDAYRVS